VRVYKRGKYYWASWTEGGKTCRKSTHKTDRKAADLVASRWQREQADPERAEGADTRFEDAVNRFLDSKRNADKAKGTISMYEDKCKVLVRHIGADTPIRKVTARRVDDFISDRKNEPVIVDEQGKPLRLVTQNTIHKELVALRGVLKLARRRREYPWEPRDVLPIGFSPKYTPRNCSITIEQAQAVLSELGKHRAAHVAFIVATTARRSEARNQLRKDILPGGQMIVRLRGTKTEGADREVPVTPFTRPLLDFAVLHGDGKGGRLLSHWASLTRDLERACKRAGVPKVTPNDLRRTISTWLIEGGVANHIVAKLLGHKDTTMVDRVYGRAKTSAVGDLVTQAMGAKAALPSPAVPTVYQNTAQRPEDSGVSGIETPGESADQGVSSGSTEDGERIKSPQLYRLSYQPETEQSSSSTSAPSSTAPSKTEDSVPHVYQGSAAIDETADNTGSDEPPATAEGHGLRTRSPAPPPTSANPRDPVSDASAAPKANGRPSRNGQRQQHSARPAAAAKTSERTGAGSRPAMHPTSRPAEAPPEPSAFFDYYAHAVGELGPILARTTGGGELWETARAEGCA